MLQVAEAEKEGAVLKALAQGWQREVAILEPQLYQLQAQAAASQKQVQHLFQQHKNPWLSCYAIMGPLTNSPARSASPLECVMKHVLCMFICMVWSAG